MLGAFVKEFTKYVPSQVLPALIGFFSIPVITRLFPPAEYGDYTLVMAAVAVLTVFSGWLGMGVIRFYEPNRAAGREAVFKTNALLLCAGTVATIGLVALAILSLLRPSLPERLWPLLLIGLLVFVGRGFADALGQFLRVQHRMGWFGFYKSWEVGGALALGLLLVALGWRVEGLLWGAASASLLVVPLLGRQALGRGGWSWHRAGLLSQARELAAYGFPLVASNLAAWVLSLSDRYLLGFYRSSYEVGLYAVSYSIAEKSILMLASLFMLASGPMAVELWEKEGEKAGAEFVRNVTRFFLLLCVPAVVGLSVLARPAMSVLTGPEYQSGYLVLPWVAAGAFFIGLQQRFQTGLIFRKNTAPIMAAMLGAAAFNLFLNVIFIPLYGYLAAAVTTLVCYVALAAFMVVVSRREFRWPFPFATLVRSGLASALMAAVVYPVGRGLTASAAVNLAVGVFLGAVVYALGLLVTGEITPAERRKVRQALGRRSGFAGFQGRVR